MLEVFWKIFLLSELKQKIWAYVSDDFETIFFFKCTKNCRNFFMPKFHFSWVREGLRLPARAVPLDPACYWIEDSSRNR